MTVESLREIDLNKKDRLICQAFYCEWGWLFPRIAHYPPSEFILFCNDRSEILYDKTKRRFCSADYTGLWTLKQVSYFLKEMYPDSYVRHKHDQFHAALGKIKSVLPELIYWREWDTLKIRYEEPYVDRCFRDFEINGYKYRVNLHKIYPVTKKVSDSLPYQSRPLPLYHPHPWPSIMQVFGEYQMWSGVGTSIDNLVNSLGINLTYGSIYTMIDPRGWHSVAPIGKDPCFSIMITGEPFQGHEARIWKRFKRELNIQPQEKLSETEAQDIMSFFSNIIKLTERAHQEGS